MKKRNNKDYIFLVLKGVAMGAANKVPGVSGGIVALVAGFYDELIETFKKFDLKAINLLLKMEINCFFNYINAKFLFFLFLGVIISFFSVSLVLDYLINNYEKQIWGLFFGMILGSIYFIKIKIKSFKLKEFILTFIGIIFGLSITFINPEIENNSLIFIFFCGIISISGMTLPGLSGSYLLIIIGNYKLILIDSVNNLFFCLKDIVQLNFDFINDNEKIYMLKIILIFTLGSIIGLLCLSNLLSYLLKNFKNQIISLLLGFIIGSLNIAWPWKYNNNNFDTYKGYIPINLNSENFYTITFITLGILIIYFLEAYGTKQTK